MFYLWNKFKVLRNYFAFQIFSYFFIIFFSLLSIVLVLPYFDARTFNPIEEKEYTFFSNETLNARLEFNLDEVFRRNL